MPGIDGDRVPAELRERVWESMLTAELNYRYWSELASRYVRRDRNVKVFLAVTTSSTVASWTLWRGVPELWQVLSGVSALLAVVLPLLSWQEKIKRLTSLRVEWFRTMKEYEALYLHIETGSTGGEEARRRYIAISSGETELVEDATGLPEREELKRRCQEKVLDGRGLAERGGRDE